MMFPPPSPLSKTTISKTSIPSQEMFYPSRKMINVQSLSSIYKSVGVEPSNSYEVDLSLFTQPNQHSPLGSNLLKLYPYNEQSIHFFTTLLQPQNQNSEKIATELSSHANVIFSYFLNSLIRAMDCSHRDTQSP